MYLLRAILAAVGILVVTTPSFAQELSTTPAPNPRFEVSFGYQSQVPVGAANTRNSGSFANSFGWVSRGPSFALVVLGDTIGVGHSNVSGWYFDYSLLAGPRLRLLTASRVQPFAQALLGVVGSIGGAHNVQLPPNAAFRRTEFQIAPSAGLDLPVSRSFTLRLAQVEYRSFVGGDRKDRFRVYSGAVFGIGHRRP